ncbi:DUF4153 domain-containing protein [Sphingomonas alpina]|uniref:DUF4153 domain-containing protein n=1 Tax=Sphingomonas alpina TaxID=653931 RepID=A0A7H0LMK4_9SPHN|nr:DUF4153 domain-containing protein [Sphingomonas alpina]QNQ10907.1 DUF4153 domain-containing protein [Sphingomonas alpina]
MSDEAAAGYESAVRDHGEWRARPLILAGIGLIVALILQQLLDRDYRSGVVTPEPATWRIALATAIGAGALALGFGMERLRLIWSLIFAGVVGAVGGLILYWHGNPGWEAFGGWSNASLFLSIAIAVPLFQTARDEGRWQFPYAEVHGHAWTNVVLWFACWLFVGVVFLLAHLLAALFDLIGLKILTELLGKDWFGAGMAGAAFGGALGVLRERDRVVRLLQRVVTAVLGVLAPILGVGLLIFLGALPFTGLGALWEATKSTTPILLGCVIGALILANAVIGNGSGEDGEDEATNPILRWGAMALALAILPLAVIAAVATGARIGQYGFTPDRLWALVFVILASCYGVVYLVALVRGRFDWARFVRASNLTLAFVVSGVALFLATPILSFNAISVRDQVGRLESGRTAPDKFDWAALAFDFGDPGKAAIGRLAKSSKTAIATRAKEAAGKENRWQVTQIEEGRDEADKLVNRLRVLPKPVPLPYALRQKLTGFESCGSFGRCTVFYSPSATEAIVLREDCVARPESSNVCAVARFWQHGSEWRSVLGGEWRGLSDAQQAALKRGAAAGSFEIRTVPRRQVFVGGVPVGEPFE